MNNLSKTDKSFFKAAQSVSMLSDHRCKIGCIIVDKHRIISSGYNSDTKCHPIQAEVDRNYFNCHCTGKLHAETRAMIPLFKTKEDYTRATLYTYRELKDGALAMSRPCARCMSLLKQLGITKIKYTTPDGYATEYLRSNYDGTNTNH